MKVEETRRQELLEQNIQDLHPVKLYVNIMKSSGMEEIPFISQYFAALCDFFSSYDKQNT